MHSFPLKTSSNFHCLFLNFHTQSVAFCSVPSVLFLEGTGYLQLILWTPVLTMNWWQVHLLRLWFLRSGSFLLFFVLSVWPTRLLPTPPLPPRGCRAVGQCPVSHYIRIHPWPQCPAGARSTSSTRAAQKYTTDPASGSIKYESAVCDL